LEKKDLARWQRTVVDMAIHGSYQIFHESMEKTKYNQTHPATAEVLDTLAEHEVDPMPDADEDSIHAELPNEEDITKIAEYQASVTVRKVELQEKHLQLSVDEHSDGHKNPERLETPQKDLEQVQLLKRASRAHGNYPAIDSTGDYKRQVHMTRSLSAERLNPLGDFNSEPA
jgi:hypothetical protein